MIPHSIDSLHSGMVLTDDIRSGGAILLPGGTALTSEHIESLRRRNIQAVLARTPVLPEELECLRHAETERVDQLFRHAGDNPLMHELRDALLTYLLGRFA